MVHSYGLSAQAQAYLSVAKKIGEQVASVNAAEVDELARFPVESMKSLAESGLMGLCLSKEFGGQGEGMRTFAAVTEELAMACGSTAMVYVMHTAAAQAIASSSVFAERAPVLKDISSGKHLTTLAFSEAGSRSQFWAPVSKLEQTNGHFTTSASKSWVTSAAHADSYVATAQ